MHWLKARQLAIPLVALLVVFAGCSGGGGDGTGTAADTATPTEQMETSMSNGDTATPTETMSDATPTPTQTTTSDSGDGEAKFSPSESVAALRNAGSYTVNYRIEGAGGAGGSFSGMEKVNLKTGERYARLTTSTSQGNRTIEYYKPADSEQAYQRVGGQTQQIPSNRAFFFNLSQSAASETFNGSSFTAAGTASTSMGTANKYVVTSVEDLPKSAKQNYDSIESVDFAVFVDKDTGVIVKYDYQITYVRDGNERTVRVVFEVSNVGSTTVDKPDWVP